MKLSKVAFIAGVLTVLLSISWMASTQNKPWESKPCKEDPATCGIIVTFKPSIEDALLLVPNQVTVDVPLQLHATKVIVQSYPRGTGVGDIPNKGLAAMYRFHKIAKYARFRGEIEKCTDQGSVEVEVFSKGFEHNPTTAYGMAVECKRAEASP